MGRGRRKAGAEVQEFRALTEALRRHRTGIRPQFWPEVAAWLLVQRKRYEHELGKITAGEHRYASLHQKAWIDFNTQACEVCTELVDRISVPMNRDQWNDAVLAIDAMLQAEVYGDTPERMDPTGTVPFRKLETPT